MWKTFDTKNGSVYRECTPAEVDKLAASGDIDARTEKTKKAYAEHGQLQDKVNDIARLLGLIE